MSDDRQAENTDREIYRTPDKGLGAYYSDSIHVTKHGGIGINVGGRVIVLPLRDWHSLARQADNQMAAMRQESLRLAIEAAKHLGTPSADGITTAAKIFETYLRGDTEPRP